MDAGYINRLCIEKNRVGAGFDTQSWRQVCFTACRGTLPHQWGQVSCR